MMMPKATTPTPDPAETRGVMTDQAAVPINPYEAADWIVARHPWAAELARRVAGPLEDDEEGAHWVDRLGQAVHDDHAWSQQWTEYEYKTPPPRDPDDEAAYDRWHAAGPKGTPGAQCFAPMSSGEKRMVRLLATLSRHPAAWTVHEVSYDERGAAILTDWLAVVRGQLPDWIYPAVDHRERDRAIQAATLQPLYDLVKPEPTPGDELDEFVNEQGTEPEIMLAYIRSALRGD